MCEQWVLESIAQGVHNCATALGFVARYLGNLWAYATCLLIGFVIATLRKK